MAAAFAPVEVVTVDTPGHAHFGSIEIWDDAFANAVAPDAVMEELATGFVWAEGPVWDNVGKQLIFSDVNNNVTYAWSEAEGLSQYLNPVTGPEIAALHSSSGTNGLVIGNDGKMLAAVHGSRAIESIDIQTKERTILVGNYQGKTFSAPNDLIQSANGDIYFTDPPYGLKEQDEDPMKETDFNGVYRLSADGELSVLDESLTRPNGIALSPDESRLYVAVSDENAPMIYRYTKDTDGNYANRELWFDGSSYLAEGLRGLPDGLVVADDGVVYATGPGGVFVLSPEGKALGQFRTGIPAANCTLGDDGKTLYITAFDRLLRVRVKSGVSY
ncbi:MAG: gluconolactonase [Robiginitomaculum sp.]|nr:MAG: gluconolactonase [Robiginitomaculum sp.]